MKLNLFFNWRLKTKITILLLFFGYGVLQAQVSLVKGKVTGDGTSLPGVSVLVKGTKFGAATDVDGNYQIKVKPTDVLVFSFIGFTSKEVKVNGKTVLNVSLESNVSNLSEVVVVGYGTQKKKEVTGAVAQVKSDELVRNSTSDLGSALQGQIAGVNVTASSGEPGSDSNILIRGLSSINGFNSPLYVVDGFAQESDPKLSINEIETIDVLKDAASAAIYGTRGAAGVILITTKRGKIGKMNIKLDSYYGIQSITSGIPLMNFEDDLYVAFLSKQTLNGTFYNNSWTPLVNDKAQFTNRSDLRKVIQVDNAPIQNHSLSVSGGKDGLSYNITGNLFSQKGSIINSAYDRFNLRSNTNYKKGKWNVTTGIGIRIENQSYATGGLFGDIYKYHPYQKDIDPNQEVFVDPSIGTGGNEVASLSSNAAKLGQTDNRKGENLTVNFSADYDISKDFKYSFKGGIGYTNNTRIKINPLISILDAAGTVVPQAQRSGVRNTSDRSQNYSLENIINYKHSFGKNNVAVTGVYSREEYQFSSFYADKRDFVNSNITVLTGALNDASVGIGTGYNQDRINAITGKLLRLQYNYAGKYLLSLSARNDGSSRFGKNYRYETFPSASIGWNVSDEDFWQPYKGFASTFKFRASYGTTGNQGIQDYSYSSTITLNQDAILGSTDNLVSGAIQNGFANPNVKWETSVQRNFGYDLGFFNNALTFSSDFYVTTKQDLLLPLLLPPSAGSGTNSTVILNVGDMRNIGTEYSLNYKSSGHKFGWNANLNYSQNDNKITKMSGTNKIAYLNNSTVVDGVPSEDLVSVIAEGYTAGSFFLLKTNGIVKTLDDLLEYRKIVPSANYGDLMDVDQLTVDTDGDGIPDKGDGKIDKNDRVNCGSGSPKFEMGLNFGANYKKFDFSMLWYTAQGGKIMNGSKAATYKQATGQDLVYQWSPQNPDSNIPTNRGRDHENYRGYTDYWLEDGSFIRLKNIQLGYTLPKSIISKLGISKFRVYVAAQNLITITKYTGFDPEVGNNGLSTRGLDKGNYPISSQLRAGVQFEF